MLGKQKSVVLIKKYYFVAIVLIAIIIKSVITINLPIYARDPSGADEYLMMSQAEHLVDGDYLGPYNYLTLVKGIGFPLFLAFSFKIGIPLLALYNFFYITVCLVAMVPIRRMIKRRPLQLLAFLMLLFCPATLDWNVQLIYRNMLIIPQSVLLVSALMMMYYHANDNWKKLLLWSLVASFSWVFMWHTREDSIWSVPLLIIAWLVIMIVLLKNKKQLVIKKVCNKQVFFRLCIISLPFILLFLSNQIISFINYRHYGVYTTNQLNNSNYTKAVMAMMRVKPVEEVDRVEITRDTLLRLYEVSPSLNTLKDIIEDDYENKRGLVMAGDDNGEINEDLITWELTGAASAKDYYKDAQTAEKFWGDVYSEVLEAINDGRLDERTILPSRSLIPWPNKPDSFGKLISSIGSLFVRGATYENSNVDVNVSVIDEDTARRYEIISGGYVVREGDLMAKRGSRWVGYAKKIRKIYSVSGLVLLCLSVIYYFAFTVFMVVKSLRKQNNLFDRWLFLSAILGGVTVMLVGLGYVNAFMVDVNGYIAGCNGLLNMFITLASVFVLQDAICIFLRLRRCHVK